MKALQSIMILAVAGSGFAQKQDSVMIKKIYNQALTNGKCYSNLGDLCNIGPRLSGSPGAEKAVKWATATMKQLGCESVVNQECMVPHWVRGEKEQARILSNGKKESLNICALGGSVATPKEGITAAVIEVKSVEELYKLGTEKIKGKIVFFNRPFEKSDIDPFHAYSKAVDQRWKGPSIAGKFGAVATVCRSMTTDINDFPHTGSLVYFDSIPQKVPACAISTLGAEKLNLALLTDPQLKLFLKMNCETLPDEKSYNVVGEIKGTEHPEQIILVGGHLDAWDNGQGAHDDGAGVVEAMEVIYLMKSLGIKPKRTIRAVAFMNEENGRKGGDKYAELAKKNNEKHILAVESDRGALVPRGFSFSCNAEQRKKIESWKRLFESYGVHDFSQEGGGWDIEPLHQMNVPVMELIPDPQRYFDYHHTSNDTFDMINKRELELGAATLAAMVYLVSEYGL